MEEIKDNTIKLQRKLRIVSWPFIAHESVRAIHLVPAVLRADLVEPCVNRHAALKRNMRILSSPNHQQLTVNIFRALEGVVIFAVAQTVSVDIGGIEAGGGPHIGIHRRTEGK